MRNDVFTIKREGWISLLPFLFCPFPSGGSRGRGRGDGSSSSGGAPVRFLDRIRVDPAAEFRLIHFGWSGWCSCELRAPAPAPVLAPVLAPAAADVAAEAMQGTPTQVRPLGERERWESDWSSTTTIV